MIVRAKMVVECVELLSYGGEHIRFRCQYSENPEDNSFAEATPSGSMELTISNPKLANFFNPNDVIYLNIEKA